VTDKLDHRHANPSAALAVGAVCNGTEEDDGCGQFVRLDEFPKDTWADYFDPYLQDIRSVNLFLEELDVILSLAIDGKAQDDERWKPQAVAIVERSRRIRETWAIRKSSGR
jgi:hypothetical protein